jgi:hypothetical protein
MLTSKKSRAHRLVMLSRRGKRPWDDVKQISEWDSRLRLRRLFAMGLSDEEIGKIIGIDPGVFLLLRPSALKSKRRRLSPVEK